MTYATLANLGSLPKVRQAGYYLAIMKKNELLAILASYGDDDEFLVEGWENGFDEPTIYVTAARPRRPDEFVTGLESDYADDREGKGCVIIGTSRGCSN